MIQNESNRAQQTKQRFVREYNIKVLDEWLSGCVSFCLQENPKISNESLFQFAFSQWLLADLNEVGVGAFAPGLEETIDSHMLTGTFPVQMQYLLDISEPAYEQWRNLYDKKLDEAEDEVQMRRSQAPQTKKRRMLKLELTDGKQTAIAMEHTAIRCLNTKLAPGVKLLLSGPIRCVNRVLFLESKNLRVLGGEVDILLISNAYENVLLRALNKPANPNPKIDYEEPEVVENKHRPNHTNIQPVPMENYRVVGHDERKNVVNKTPPLVVDDVDDDSLLMGIDLDAVEASQSRVAPVSKPEQVASISTLMDDDELDDIVQQVEVPDDPEVMDQQVSSTKHSQPSPKPRVTGFVKPTFDEPLDDDFDLMNSLENQIQSEFHGFQSEPPAVQLAPPMAKKSRVLDDKFVTPLQSARKTPAAPQPPSSSFQSNMNHHKNPVSPQPSSSKMFHRFSASSLFEDSMDYAEAEEPSLATANITSPNYTFRIDGTNLATLDQIASLSEDKLGGASFVVYCEVSAVTDQPRIRKERWHLTIVLTDQSEQHLSVRLHNDVIAKLVRHDAGELMRKHKTDREGVMKLLDTILVEFKELLQEIKCFWRVVYPSKTGDSELPVVMESYEMNDERGSILLDKIIKENCSQLRKML
ncbi:recQ-mediated genome instability protein 1-like [Anopheles ziemanni]|uniref:recQ-mediated genome instability protein 1-like n=1 Tax=Anopheles coustani TaxID=139045 RepID=UPI002659E5FB|nr:recQ-mediated genome instability protein 1-like [Anopheles coustani]XP_058173109.1 recQ-mediated genome instability protein 1-like [Anopheles ziemanni]